jgi:hypothetical protein
MDSLRSGQAAPTKARSGISKIPADLPARAVRRYAADLRRMPSRRIRSSQARSSSSTAPDLPDHGRRSAQDRRRPGDIALMHTEWKVSSPQQVSLYAIEVARRQPDSTWRWLIGDPFTVGRQAASSS